MSPTKSHEDKVNELTAKIKAREERLRQQLKSLRAEKRAVQAKIRKERRKKETQLKVIVGALAMEYINQTNDTKLKSFIQHGLSGDPNRGKNEVLDEFLDIL